MAKDLRSFISRLKQFAPDQLVTVDKSIDSKFEITGLLQHMEDQKKFPAVLFSNVKNIKGEGNQRVFTNVMADRSRIALSVDMEPDQWKVELTKGFAERAENRIKTTAIAPENAPVKEVVRKGDEVDLSSLPMVYHHEMDGNPYGTMLALTKKPDNLGYNLAYHRTMYKDPKHTGIHMSPFHTRRIYELHEKENKPTPVVLVPSHHPAFSLAGDFMSPWSWNEYEVAGGFLNESVRLTPSETWGEDFMVPADAEIVIEGEILPNHVEPEGPFGEWPSYYGPQRQNPVIRVKAITHRKDYIWSDTNIGHLDHPTIGWESEIYRRVNDALPGCVKGVYGPWSGRGGFHIYISIDKMAEGLPSMAFCAAQTVGYPKLIVVVDKDIDAYNEQEVLFAVATRFQGDKDLTVMKNVRGTMLDPSMSELHTHTSVFIDATKPCDEPFPEIVKVPAEVLERIKLNDFIDQETLTKVPLTQF